VRVLVAGHVTLDRVGPELLPGGSAWYAARCHRGLGAEVRVATAAGPEYPRAALAGLECAVAAAPGTTTFANAYAGGRRTQRVERVAPPLDPAALPAAWREAGLLHLAPVAGELDLRAWLAAVRAPFVGLGVQGWLRRVEPDGAVTEARCPLEAADLAGVGAAVLGDDDARGDPALAERLAATVPVVAFTHGAAGCEVLARGRRLRVGAFPTREVDPTGAGDAFAAAFFLALARGEDPADAARLGAAAGSIVVEARAGEALARIGEAVARRDRIPAFGAAPPAR
jgi:sugar/nucleoside kinase (ribokinase family)